MENLLIYEANTGYNYSNEFALCEVLDRFWLLLMTTIID